MAEERSEHFLSEAPSQLSDRQVANKAGGGGGAEARPSAADQNMLYHTQPQPLIFMAPAAPQRRCACINSFKLPELGTDDICENKQLLKQLIAEFLGTTLLVFFGIGSILTSSNNFEYVTLWQGYEKCVDPNANQKDKAQNCHNSVNYTYSVFNGDASTLHISFAFGMAVACIAQAIGHISGAHLNPSVTFGLVAAGECSVLKAIVYSVVQIIGGIFGVVLVKICSWKVISPVLKHSLYCKTTPGGCDPVPTGPFRSFAIKDSYWSSAQENKKDGKNYPEFIPAFHTLSWHLGASHLSEETHWFQGVLIESTLTFILVLTVCGVSDKLRSDVKGSAPLAVGFAVFLCHVVGIHYTGCSVNPARSIGPVAFVKEEVEPNVYKDLWVYLVGPMFGGILAGLMYNLLFRASPPVD